MGLDLRLTNNSYQNTYESVLSSGLKCCQTMCENTGIRDIVQARNLLEKNKQLYTCFHSNLATNLAGSTDGSMDPQFNRKLTNCKQKLLNELDIATMVGTDLVVHFGSNKERQFGIRTIIDSVNELLITENINTISYARLSEVPLIDFTKKRQIVLENSAGKGNSLGVTLDEMSIVLSQINPTLRDNVNICIDTCHLSDASQYDFGTIGETDRFYNDFSQKIGLEKLKLFHMNDSKGSFGCKWDRHEHLGYGKIFGQEGGIKGLKEFVINAKDKNIPLIGEFSDGGGMEDVRFVNQLI